MLNHRYRVAHRKKGPAWTNLDRFFSQIDPQTTGFISMNWDTVIERKLAVSRSDVLFDYCCDALPASIPHAPDEDRFSSKKSFLKEIQKGQVIRVGALPVDRKLVERSTPVVKIHGSTNWLYCDNCGQVFWVHPDQSDRIADQLIREDDLARIRAFLGKSGQHIEQTFEKLRLKPQLKCQCSEKVALGIRIATFSYRKALDFPMFQKSWFAAEELLRSARRWVFIGYSLPAADYEFKYLLKRTQLSRQTSLEVVVVSGGTKRSARLTYNNYHKFFGRIVSKVRFFPSGLTADAVRAITG